MSTSHRHRHLSWACCVFQSSSLQISDLTLFPSFALYYTFSSPWGERWLQIEAVSSNYLFHPFIPVICYGQSPCIPQGLLFSKNQCQHTLRHHRHLHFHLWVGRVDCKAVSSLKKDMGKDMAAGMQGDTSHLPPNQFSLCPLCSLPSPSCLTSRPRPVPCKAVVFMHIGVPPHYSKDQYMPEATGSWA